MCLILTFNDVSFSSAITNDSTTIWIIGSTIELLIIQSQQAYADLAPFIGQEHFENDRLYLHFTHVFNLKTTQLELYETSFTLLIHC